MRYAKTEAEAKRKLREMKKTAYQAPPEQRRKQTVEKYILDWFPRYKKGLKPASYDRQENSITHQIIPYFGQYQIHSVVSSDVKDMMNRLQYEKGYAYSTVKKAYDTLNECLRQAVEDGILERRYRLGYAFILILNTGIRVGEALALRTHGDMRDTFFGNRNR